MENRLASRTPFERLRRDTDVKTEQQVYGAWTEHMVAVIRGDLEGFHDSVSDRGKYETAGGELGSLDVKGFASKWI